MSSISDFEAENKERPEEVLVALLTKHGFHVTTVESCTGGKVGARIVSVPGASAVYEQGFITYSNEAKHRLVDVSSDTLKAYGAVSSQTAKEMVQGANRRYGSEVALSVTGIAGPDGGTKEKPVGLVYIGVAINDKTYVQELNLKGDRESIRNQSADAVLTLAAEKLSRLK